MARVQIVTEPLDRWFTYYEPTIRKTSRTVYLVGYWQSYLIPQSIEPRLRCDLAFRNGPIGQNIEMGRLISRANYAVSLHLRRGDYKTIKGFNAVLPLEYYDQAIAEYRSRRRDVTFFVFSDDHGFAREWVRDKPHMTLINQNDEETASEDLRLMSTCQSHIIANSTFSWWGAWLNSKEDKQVIAPPTWWGNSTRDIQIIPPEWTILD